MKRFMVLTLLAGCALGPDDPPRPPDAEDVTMEFCGGLPPVFAYKNDDYEWVFPSTFVGETAVTFPARSRVTVLAGSAFATTTVAVSDLTIYNLSRDEADSFRCSSTPAGGAQMGGFVDTDGGDDITFVQMGDAFAATFGDESYVLRFLGEGSRDLVALNRLGDVTASGRVIVRNNVTVSHGTVMPELDFTNSEAKTLDTVRISAVPGGPAVIGGETRFESFRRTLVPITGELAVADTVRLPVIPASLVKSGDLHRFDLASASPERGLAFWQPIPKDTTVSFGPELSAATLETTATGSQLVRHTLRFASQAEYGTFADVRFRQTTPSTQRTIQVVTSVAYLGTLGAEWAVELPDLRGVVGDEWLMRAGTTTTWIASARGGRIALHLGAATPAAGETIQWATKQGQ